MVCLLTIIMFYTCKDSLYQHIGLLTATQTMCSYIPSVKLLMNYQNGLRDMSNQLILKDDLPLIDKMMTDVTLYVSLVLSLKTSRTHI